MTDQAAREHAIEGRGSVLVQAPAGSGKTTLLAQRYLRLLAEVDSPERILALTFTRRAAQEMRDRVLAALAAARLTLCPAHMQPTTWRLARDARRRLAALQIDVERQPSRLRIETIDAFNAWLASQLPVAAGSGSQFQVLDDAAPSYAEAARRALAHEPDDQFGVAVDRVLALDDQRWRGLVDLISEMLRSRDRWLPLLAGRLQSTRALDAQQLERVRRHLDEDLGLLVVRVLNRALDVIGGERIEALSRLIQGAAMHLGNGRLELADCAADGSALRATVRDLGRWRGVASLLLTATGDLRKKFTKNEGFPPQSSAKASIVDLVQELESNPVAKRLLKDIRMLPAAAYSDEQWARVRDVAQVLVLAAAELQQVFREQGAVDFPEVSLAALRALGSADAPSDLGLRLDYRLQHILVDEFQDTSSAQLELVRLLTAGWQRGDGRSVFCVGDPMQSIYGFRQAEVRAFLELAEDGIGELKFDVQRLSDNFRSAAPLVEWINRCFSRILPRVDDRERGAIAFRASSAAGQSHATTPSNAEVGLKGFASGAEESAAIAALIGERIEQHPDWRIVVLVRARSHAGDIAASLRARGIGFRAVDLEPLQERGIVRDIIMLLCALLHFGDRIAWLAVLRAPWAGLSLADLWSIARAAPLIWDALSQVEALSRLSEDGRARCARLRTIFEAAFRVRAETTVTRWVERTWLALGGPSCAAGEDLDLAAVAFARLNELERRGLPDAADLPASFADLYADHGAASNVEIMTIHKAKGLEFDCVVVPALVRHIPMHHDQLLMSHQFARAGRDGLVMAARPPVGAEKDRLFDFLRHQVRDGTALEAQRLLYVACTRAKWQLHLTATIDRQRDLAEAPEFRPPRLWSPRVGSLLAVLWPVVGEEFAIANPTSASRGRSAGAPRGGPLARVPSDWVPEVATPRFEEPMPASASRREETPIFDWAGETARRVGTLVHAELQAMDLSRADVATIQRREPNFRRWLKSLGVPADRLSQAAARVVEALVAVIDDPRGRWILQVSREESREQALSGRLEGEVVRAVFDRSFVDDQGVRWVIDYKTSQHIGGGLDVFLDREVERYRPQLRRYAELASRLGPEPVRLGLYFPLMRAWREWGANDG
jgi:ATP-dependent helicase/nuclease subunit A